jgi:hypothetical protein
MSHRYLSAYYYSFEATGCDAVDAILEAVARAGKGYHHTDSWSEPDGDGVSYVDKIQNAAKDAAALFAARSEHQSAGRDSVLEALDLLDEGFRRPFDHLDGCLFKENPRLSCQCNPQKRIFDFRQRVFAFVDKQRRSLKQEGGGR